MRTLLIDADIPIYEVAARHERSIPWPYGDQGSLLWTRTADLEPAQVAFEEVVEHYMTRLAASDRISAVTIGSANWRKDVYPDYKSNRAGGIKPILVPILREWVSEQPSGRSVSPLEGDDVLGILATKPHKAGAPDTVIVSSDKDMRCIPGLHYNPQKDEEFEVTPGQANAWHLIQALAGDRTDGYPGCPGLGMVRAEKMIPSEVSDKQVFSVWMDVIVPAYDKAGLDEEYALSQARVARILRASDYNPKTKEVKLWYPTPTKGKG
jgi:DNA polymerase-1